MTESTDNYAQQLDAIARKISSMRLSTPCILFLEAHLPLLTLFHTASIFLEPLMTPLFGTERISTLRDLLSKRENIELLIELIERYERKRPVRHPVKQPEAGKV